MIKSVYQYRGSHDCGCTLNIVKVTVQEVVDKKWRDQTDLLQITLHIVVISPFRALVAWTQLHTILMHQLSWSAATICVEFICSKLAICSNLASVPAPSLYLQRNNLYIIFKLIELIAYNVEMDLKPILNTNFCLKITPCSESAS